jgi:hypothetical protein
MEPAPNADPDATGHYSLLRASERIGLEVLERRHGNRRAG